MFCPRFASTPSEAMCKACKSKECVDFNLFVICEHPDNSHNLIPKLSKMLSKQIQVNFVINGIENDEILLPQVPAALDKYTSTKGYNLIIVNSFKEEKYDTMIEMCFESTGCGVVIYGSESFSNKIVYRIRKIANDKYNKQERNDLFKKTKIKIVKEKIDKNVVNENQMMLF